MSSGSSNALQAQKVISQIEQTQALQGIMPGQWTLSATHIAICAKAVEVDGEPTLSVSDIALAQAAVAKSNAAAVNTPSAASGNPTTSSTDISKISSIVEGITSIADIPKNFKKLEAGATATLHWWGWELLLDESATEALQSLLKNDIVTLISISTALLSTGSAPFAAVLAIISGASTGLSIWVNAENNVKKGVDIEGYLWIGVWVSPNS